MSRETLPNRRGAWNFPVNWRDQTFDVSIGFLEGGSVGEVFVSGNKSGTDMETLMRDGAILISLALQHGAQVDTLKGAVTRGEVIGLPGQEGNLPEPPASLIGALIDAIVAELPKVRVVPDVQ